MRTIQKDSPSERILVTGSAGFLGAFLCRRLIEADLAVVGVTRSQVLHSAVPTVSCDLTEIDSVRQAIAAVSPTAVCHLAGLPNMAQNPDLLLGTFRNNAQASVNLLVALKEAGFQGRFVTAGTVADQECSPYGISKVVSRIYADYAKRNLGIDSIEARLHFCYGPGQSGKKLIPLLIDAALEGHPMKLNEPNRECDFVYVEDAAEALLQLLIQKRLPGDSVEIASGRRVRIAEVASMVEELVAKNERWNTMEPYRTEPCSADSWDWKTKTSLESGLKKTIDWRKENR